MSGGGRGSPAPQRVTAALLPPVPPPDPLCLPFSHQKVQPSSRLGESFTFYKQKAPRYLFPPSEA